MKIFKPCEPTICQEHRIIVRGQMSFETDKSTFLLDILLWFILSQQFFVQAVARIRKAEVGKRIGHLFRKVSRI